MTIDSNHSFQNQIEDSPDSKRVRDSDSIPKDLSSSSSSMKETNESAVAKKRRKRPIHVEVMVDPASVVAFEILELEVEKFIRSNFEPSFMVRFCHF